MSAALHRAIQRAYNGILDPAVASEKSSRARDFQFELWLGAWLAMGGRAVKYAEPDLRCVVWFEWRGIAAKRVTSAKKVLTRVQEAAKQVRNHSGTGIVALSLDNYAHRRNRSGASVRSAKSFYRSIPQLAAAEKWLHEKAPWVLCLMVFGSLASWRTASQRPSVEMTDLHSIQLFPNSERDQEHFSNFFNEHHTEYLAVWRRLRESHQDSCLPGVDLR